MKNILRTIRLVTVTLIACLALAGVSHAQTTLTNTTLGAAITNANDSTMTIASTTGWTATSSGAQAYALIDREVVGIRAVNTTTKVITITRGLMGTRATGHANAATVYFVDPTLSTMVLGSNDRSGACSTSGSSDFSQNGAYVPVFNPATGRSFTCTSGGIWVMSPDYMGTAVCTVTQATSKSTGVTCTGTRGTITMNGAALAAAAEVGFTVTDTLMAATDVAVVNVKSGATADSYQVTVDAVAAGSFRISVSNASAGSLSEAIVLNFKVVKD